MESDWVMGYVLYHSSKNDEFVIDNLDLISTPKVLTNRGNELALLRLSLFRS